MARLKIDYGIDLGTTNSSVCRMEKGHPVVKKIEVTDDTMPSCVFFNKKKGIVVGASAYRSMKSDKRRATKTWNEGDSNTYIEVKRTMGTDRLYHSSNMGRDYTSEELSAEILKALKSFITDEPFRSVVVTVPAKFTVNQKTATLEAAKLAGFEQCELLQEPIAAALAYGVASEEKNGYWMVFDFGGGPFDAALLKVDEGIIQVFDTEGDNYLGGKNLDYAIVDELIIPSLRSQYAIAGILSDPRKKGVLRDALKTYAEDVKNQLSFKKSEDIISNLGDLGEDDNGEEIEIDLTLTQEQVFSVMRPLFQKAVDICKTLLARNGMKNDMLNKLILVGGPTYSPLIRSMLREQLTEHVDCSIDPMTAVAKGAALYASTCDATISVPVETGSVHLNLGFESTSVELDEFVSVKFDQKASDGCQLGSVFVEIVRNDEAWSSGKKEINSTGDIFEVHLVEGKANSFSVYAYDKTGNRLSCYPEEFTIIQGTKLPSPPLPYHIGIAVWSDQRNKLVFMPAIGLEKNKPIPATGVLNNRRMSSPLRPGVAADILKIPVYQADEYRTGASAGLYEHVADVIVTGADIMKLVPESSIVDITLKVDTSEMMRMKVFFPQTGEYVEKELDTSTKQTVVKDKINSDLQEAEKKVKSLQDEGIDVADIEESLRFVRRENENSSEDKMVLQHLKEVMRTIEQRDDEAEWKRVEQQLLSIYSELDNDQRKYGDITSKRQVDYLHDRMEETIQRKDINIANTLIEQMRNLDVRLARIEYLASYLYHVNKNFNSIAWKNPTRARELINEGINLLNHAPNSERIGTIVQEIADYAPDTMRSNEGNQWIH